MGTSYLLIFVPNVETITLSVFFCGYSFRYRFSLKLMLATLIVWEMVASVSWGFSMVAFPFKFAGWILVFLAGRLAKTISLQSNLEFAAAGAILTLVWDAIATISTALILGSSFKEFLAIYFASIILGIPFTIIHVISNTYLFFMFPYLIKSVVPNIQTKYPNCLRMDA